MIAQFNPGRPVSAYTVPFNFLDVGVDGVGSWHTRATIGWRRSWLTLLGVPNTADVNTRFPVTNVTHEHPR